jgi:hypothetical protein
MVGKEIFVRFGAVQDNRDPTRRFRSPADRHADRADQRADRYKEPGDRYEKFSDPAHVVIQLWQLRQIATVLCGSKMSPPRARVNGSCSSVDRLEQAYDPVSSRLPYSNPNVCILCSRIASPDSHHGRSASSHLTNSDRFLFCNDRFFDTRRSGVLRVSLLRFMLSPVLPIAPKQG